MSEKLLCECDNGAYPGQRTDDDWYRFEAAAHAAGHASGTSAANDRGLWSMPVNDAIALMRQEVSDEADV